MSVAVGETMFYGDHDEVNALCLQADVCVEEGPQLGRTGQAVHSDLAQHFIRPVLRFHDALLDVNAQRRAALPYIRRRQHRYRLARRFRSRIQCFIVAPLSTSTQLQLLNPVPQITAAAITP